METNTEHELSAAKIGDSLSLQLSERNENRLACAVLAQQARTTLDIVSRDFDKHIFDTSEFYEAVKTLATSNRKARIRILISDSEKVIKYGHRLLELARRLTSYIDIKVQGKSFKDFNESWLVADETAWLRQPHADRYEAEINFSDARRLREVLKDFDTMWNEATHDQNLRRLSL